MTRRSIFAFGVVVVALLALTVPARAGGWAVVTLDALPREVRAGAALQLGFMVLQHGKTPTNTDLNGNPLTPLLTATKQGDPAVTIRAEARQEGRAGHYVVDVTFPSDGSWAWQIAVPTFMVQDSSGGSNAAIFAPISVLPALAPAPPPMAQPAAVPVPETTTWLGISSAA